MQHGYIDFPDSIMDAVRNDHLVIFAGAGVSMGPPASLPDFPLLASLVAAGTGQVISENEPPDRFFGQLDHIGTEVHRLAAEKLSQQGDSSAPIHTDILRVFKNSESVRIVTTNFDLLFEHAINQLWGKSPEIYSAPALPIGKDFKGIVHIHGSIISHNNMVLTDRDFGRAYLIDGWARRFLVDLFQHYTVLFIGYSHDDPVMRYLSRALPVDGKFKRFALDKESEPSDKWEFLGIDKISFPVSDPQDYEALNDGVKKLADYTNRTVLEIQQKVTELAESGPPPELPSSQEDIDFLKAALHNEAQTRFFVKAAKKTAWLPWLDKHKMLNPLFENEPLDKKECLLSQWIVNTFVEESSDELFILFGKYRLHFNSDFWSRIARCVSQSENFSVDNYKRWVTVLLAEKPSIYNGIYFRDLAAKSIQLNLPHEALRLFELMASNQVAIREPLSWPNDESGASRLPRVEMNFLANHWEFENVWTSCISPNLSELATGVLDFVTSRLSERFSTLSIWRQTNSYFDSDSYSRSAIEPHEQDKYPTVIDVVIDAARESIDWMANNRIDELEHRCSMLIREDAHLLRRLAIYGVMINDRWSASQKIEWLLTNVDLNDNSLRYEIFNITKLNYSQIGIPLREQVVEEILKFEWPNQDDEEKEGHEAYSYYNWLHWLFETCPDCPVLDPELSKIIKVHPNFEPREYPGLRSWSGGGTRVVGSQSPWSVEQLLGREAVSWLDELLDFKEDGFDGPDRNGLLLNVTEAAKGQFDWGQSLAVSLSEKENWSSDIWGALISAWSDWLIEKEKAEVILCWLERDELQGTCNRAISDLVHALVKNESEEHVDELIVRCNQIAVGLWNKLETCEDASTEVNSWLGDAINRSAGVIALFWMSSLSIWNKKQKLECLVDEYKTPIEQMLNDDTIAGGYARSVIGSQFSFLLAIDEDWAKVNVLPLFSSDDSSCFQQAWSGFLTWGHFNHSVISELSIAFKSALSRLNDDFPEEERNRFIEIYSVCLMQVDNALQEWIPNFFEVASNQDRQVLASNIEYRIQGLGETQQEEIWNDWLSQYWQNRINGVPTPLIAEEVDSMIDWIPHLTKVFPEAVIFATQMPIFRIERTGIICDLKDSSCIEAYPDSVAELLVFLMKCEPVYGLHGIDEVLQKLSEHSLNIEVKSQLVEELTLKGIDTACFKFYA